MATWPRAQPRVRRRSTSRRTAQDRPLSFCPVPAPILLVHTSTPLRCTHLSASTATSTSTSSVTSPASSPVAALSSTTAPSHPPLSLLSASPTAVHHAPHAAGYNVGSSRLVVVSGSRAQLHPAPGWLRLRLLPQRDHCHGGLAESLHCRPPLVPAAHGSEGGVRGSDCDRAVAAGRGAGGGVGAGAGGGHPCDFCMCWDSQEDKKTP